VNRKPIVCIGASLVDETYHLKSRPLNGTSNPATLYRAAGGVSRNIAHHLALLGNPVKLITHFGKDADGDWLAGECLKAGIDLADSIRNSEPTGKFTALLSPEGDLFAGAVACRFEEMVTPAFLEAKTAVLKSASLLLIDTNLGTEALSWLLDFSRSEKIPCAIEPVSVPKAARLKEANLSGVLLLTPNLDELAVLSGMEASGGFRPQVNELLGRGLDFLWVRKGKSGSGLYSATAAMEFPAPVTEVVDTTGAGDAALAGFLHAWLQNLSPERCVIHGHAMAALILRVQGAVLNSLSPQMLQDAVKNYKP
jgi:pseudouridine kinase